MEAVFVMGSWLEDYWERDVDTWFFLLACRSYTGNRLNLWEVWVGCFLHLLMSLNVIMFSVVQTWSGARNTV